MTASLTVRPVHTPADENTFLRFPWHHYRNNPYWVPPLVSLQRHRLDRQRAASWKYMEGDYFIAWRGGEPVGTVAAFINHRHNEYHNEHIGCFGMFHTVNDQAVADALLGTAADWVAARGYDAVRGPLSFSMNDEFGVLVEGFDDPPAALTIYNYPYYEALVANAPGFAKVMDTFCYHFTLDNFHRSKSLEQALRVTERNNRRRSISVRRLQRKNLRRDLQLFRELYNAAWERNWGFVPMTDDELDELLSDLGQFIDPRLALFASVEGVPAGFLLAVPDLNQVLHAAHPHPDTPEPLTMLRALWHWKIRSKLTRIRIPLLGVAEPYRNLGVEAALFVALYKSFEELVATTPWRDADAGWVLETNERMHRLTLALGGEPYKRYRLFERDLT